MTTIQTISIDITNPNITPPPRVNVKQGDSKSRTVVINILDKGVLQSSLNAPCYIYFEGINGAPPTYIVGNIVDGVLTVIIPQSALTKAGTIKAEVQITDDSDTEYILSTMNFDIFVEKAVFSEDALIGSNEGSALNKYIENHNTDTSAHEDMRSAIYGQVANMIDMDVYEHDTNPSAHEDIRQLIDNSLEKIALPTNIIPHLLVSSSGDNTNDILAGRVEFYFKGEQKEYYLSTLDANSFDDGIYYLQIYKDLTISDIVISKNYMSEYIVFATVTVHNHQFTSVVGNDDASTAFHNIDSSAHEDIRQLIDNSAGKIDAESKLLTGEIFNNYTDNHALGSNSHAEGDKNTASGDNSHAEGYNNVAGGNHSHVEGSSNTINSGSTAAHAEGAQHTISSGYTHVEGYHNTVNTTGGYSHIEGRDNTADGGYQHIEGRGNRGTTNELYQHIQGKFADATQTGLAHIVGNGTSATALSNAHTLDWNGNAWFAGDVFVGEQNNKLLHGESGVCTLTNSDGTATIDGNYYVIGDLVTVWIAGVLSDSTDWNGTWSGLPFASKLKFDGVSYGQSFDNPLHYTLKSRDINGSILSASLDISNSASVGHNISFTYVKY